MAKRRKSRQSRSQFTPLLVVVGGLVLGAAALWLTLRPSSTDIAEQTSGPTKVERVSLADAKAGFDNNSVLMVDVRSETDYLAAHIQGAVLIPSSEIAARYQELPQDQLLYLYCT